MSLSARGSGTGDWCERRIADAPLEHRDDDGLTRDAREGARQGRPCDGGDGTGGMAREQDAQDAGRHHNPAVSAVLAGTDPDQASVRRPAKPRLEQPGVRERPASVQRWCGGIA